MKKELYVYVQQQYKLYHIWCGSWVSQSHFSMDFDNIVSVTLDNYTSLQIDADNAKEETLYSQSQDQWVHRFHGAEDSGSSITNISKRNSFLNIVSDSELDPTLDTAKNPSYWSRVCLHNMAKLAKETTTVWRVLEPLFHFFDGDDHWTPGKGVACSVLMYFQSVLSESGDNSHILLSILVKHLDHKNVVKKPLLQTNIVNVTSQLAQNAKQQASVAITGAISDLVKHLRKCLQNLAEVSSTGDGAYKLNTELQSALELCISDLSNKVGEVGPILDMMAVMLENISGTTIVARTTISAVYQTAKIISSIPNVSYHKKAFPDALFHQLLLAMAHPDHETRVGAYNVFSTVLIPSLFSCKLDQETKMSGKVKGESFFIEGGTGAAEPINGELEEGSTITDVNEKPAMSPSHGYSFTSAFTDGKKELSSLRLSSHQVSLLLSSIWVQATSAESSLANFKAMAYTYNIVLLFTRSKTSSYMALVRCFQLAFSLRSISLDEEGGLQPSRRRSLFTLASHMLIFSAWAGNFPDLIPIIKASLTEKAVDPFLEFDDIRLQAVHIESDKEKRFYGSHEDEVTALKSLTAVDLDEKQLKETVISYFMTKFAKLSEDELSSIKKQLQQGFSPDDAYPLGPPLFMETPRPCSPFAQLEFPDFDEVMPPVAVADEEAVLEPSGSQSDRKSSLSINTIDILSVNQLLESVLETARQVASFPVSSAPVPYDEMKSQCEALVKGKQNKMSVLHSFKHQQETNASVISSENERRLLPSPATIMEFSEEDLKLVTQNHIHSCSHEYGQQHPFKLPPSSPYDKFLKAAGC
ncbi:Arm repeat superfamily protein [Quillaja saponaria]|uniref:Arm repeat superfamily protein n=1 Tax=Quillaja saponaria TaxID=32244 RepID=A0AAD7PAC3_QUISA|nr:Arm repeat superfamily protein [Quillaja saponaria]